MIAEMLSELTDDGRHRERAETSAEVGIEAVDRVQEPDAGDLLEILDRLSRMPVAMGEAPGERQIAPDRLLAIEGAAFGPQPREQQSVIVSSDRVHAVPDDAGRAGVTSRAPV